MLSIPPKIFPTHRRSGGLRRARASGFTCFGASPFGGDQVRDNIANRRPLEQIVAHPAGVPNHARETGLRRMGQT
jgi:hypothetical protein